MRPETLARLKRQSVIRAEVEKAVPALIKKKPEGSINTPCVFLGEELTGKEREDRGLNHNKKWSYCLNPSQPLGQVVCPCQGCGRNCKGYQKESTAMAGQGLERVKPLSWEYGITTVPRRRGDLLPRTLESLRRAGFDKPRLFVDGCNDPQSWEREFGLAVTVRNPALRTYGNWVLSLAELYIRNPWADRYAIFQDDFVTYRNLRGYLEQIGYVEKGYYNLYTFPSNQQLCPPGHEGWYQSNQLGRGAVALVFNREAVTILLRHQHMVDRPQDKDRGHKAVDGGIVETMKKSGWKEYVHNPSLVQHTGNLSSMGNRPHRLANSFRGEDYDAMDMAGKTKTTDER